MSVERDGKAAPPLLKGISEGGGQKTAALRSTPRGRTITKANKLKDEAAEPLRAPLLPYRRRGIAWVTKGRSHTKRNRDDGPLRRDRAASASAQARSPGARLCKLRARCERVARIGCAQRALDGVLAMDGCTRFLVELSGEKLKRGSATYFSPPRPPSLSLSLTRSHAQKREY